MRSFTSTRFVAQPYQDSPESGRVTLRDGTTAQIRPAAPGDRKALAKFFADLSKESRDLVFSGTAHYGPDFMARLTSLTDPAYAYTLLVTHVRDGQTRIVALGSYFAREEKTAELALAVADDCHRRGLGTLLLEQLALLAVRNGFSRNTVRLGYKYSVGKGFFERLAAAMFGSFFCKLGHLAFDDAWIGPVAAWLDALLK